MSAGTVCKIPCNLRSVSFFARSIFCSCILIVLVAIARTILTQRSSSSSSISSHQWESTTTWPQRNNTSSHQGNYSSAVLIIKNGEVPLPPRPDEGEEAAGTSTNNNATDPTTYFDDDTEFDRLLYNNLSCHFEWSKYSCSHQSDNVIRAMESRKLVLRHRELILSSFVGQGPEKDTRLIFIGDSLLRQIFISLACHILTFQSSLVDTFKADWPNEHGKHTWPCHATHDCVKKGPHSGFDKASLRFKNGAEIHYVASHGGIDKIVARMLGEMKDNEFATLNRKSTALVSKHTERLTSRDTLLFCRGIHYTMKGTKKSMTLLQNLAIEFDDDDNNNNKKRSATTSRGNPSSSSSFLSSTPKVWYMTTPTQHFPTKNGQYLANMKKIAACRLNVTENPRRTLEVKTLTKYKNTDYRGIRIFEYNDLNYGAYHVGGKDCSHYCMPGPPDLVASPVYHAWTNNNNNNNNQ